MSERYHNIARGGIARAVFAVGLTGGTLFGGSITAPEAGAAGPACTFAADLNNNGEVAPSEARAAGCSVPSCLDVSPDIDTDGDRFASRNEQQAADTPCAGGMVRHDQPHTTLSATERANALRAANPPRPTTPTLPPPTEAPASPTTTIYRASASASTPPNRAIRIAPASAAHNAAQSAYDDGCGKDVPLDPKVLLPGTCASKLVKVLLEVAKNDAGWVEGQGLELHARILPGDFVTYVGRRVCGSGILKVPTVGRTSMVGEQIVACGLRK